MVYSSYAGIRFTFKSAVAFMTISLTSNAGASSEVIFTVSSAVTLLDPARIVFTGRSKIVLSNSASHQLGCC